MAAAEKYRSSAEKSGLCNGDTKRRSETDDAAEACKVCRKREKGNMQGAVAKEAVGAV